MITSTTVSCRIVSPALTLEVLEVQIKQDENWAPSVQAVVTCRLPEALAADAVAIDPRGDVKLELTIVQTYLDTTAYTRTMLLHLRSRKINHRDEQVIFMAASEEALLHDDAHIAVDPITPTGTKLTQIVSYVLSRMGRVLNDSNSVANDVPISPELVTWKPGVTAYDYLYPQVKKAGLLLWADERGQWHLRDRRVEVETETTIAAQVNLTGGDDEISRDDGWYTAAVVTYRWNDAAGASHERNDSHFTTAFPARVLTVTYDQPWPGAGVARSLIQGTLARGRVNTVTAIADASVRLAQRVNVILPGTAPQLASVSSVTWTYPNDEMTVTTRSSLDY